MQDTINNLLYKTSALIDKYDSIAEVTGEHFNIFNVLRMGSSEVKLHSALIAELLNPKGNHKYGRRFLNTFLQSLQQLKLPQKDFETIEKLKEADVRVIVEKWIGYIVNEHTKGGYIDIVLSANSGETLIIENKIYAGDQRSQLRRYYNFNKKALIIYLTLDGKKAAVETTLNNEYPEDEINPICISYKTFVIEWLEMCKRDSASHPMLRETITQYIYLLKQLTYQTTNHKMNNDIVGIITQNPEFIRSAELIWKSQEAIKLKIIKNLTEEISLYAKKVGLDFDIPENCNVLGKEDTGFGFRIANRPFWIYFYFRTNFDDMEVGIDWVPKQNKDEALKIKLVNHFQDFEYGKKLDIDDWIWGSSFQAWDSTSWSEVKSKIPEEIIKTARILLNKLESFPI
jgi:hypothetical protein